MFITAGIFERYTYKASIKPTRFIHSGKNIVGIVLQHVAIKCRKCRLSLGLVSMRL